MVSDNEEVTLEMLAEFDRLGEIVDKHSLLCQCEEYCVPFMALADDIRSLSAKQKAGARE